MNDSDGVKSANHSVYRGDTIAGWPNVGIL